MTQVYLKLVNIVESNWNDAQAVVLLYEEFISGIIHPLQHRD